MKSYSVLFSDGFQLQCDSKSTTRNKIDVTSWAVINQKDHWRKERIQLTVNCIYRLYNKDHTIYIIHSILCTYSKCTLCLVLQRVDALTL